MGPHAPGSVAPGPPPGAIRWHRCALSAADEFGKALDKAGVECGELAVPMNYDDPRGTRIAVAVSRIRATDRAHRIGALLVNPGGPGGSGIDAIVPVRQTAGAVGARYDLIGMDPRFVGRSTPIDCRWPVSTAMRAGGPDPAGFARTAALEENLADRCGTTYRAVLPYATTRNTARDIDEVRRALGERRISYLGVSYGTYLGAVYLQMFPGHTDRVVLDSALDPGQYGPRLLRETGAATEAALRGWAAWTARRDARYHLGPTPRAVLATVDRLQDRVRTTPVRVAGHRVDGSIFPVVVVNGVASDRDERRADLAEAVRAVDTAAVRPPPLLEAFLMVLTTGRASAYGSAQTAILCGDVPVPHDPAVYLADIRRARATEPHAATVTRNLTPCAYWPTPVRERPTVVRNAEPALIVQADGDPRTPYAAASNLHRALTRSRMLILRGAAVHGVYGEYGNVCVDRRVNAYLASGTLPPADQSCVV